ESVFGHIKGNRSFRRFSLRGLEKVHVEFGIVAMAHNLLKVASLRKLLSGKNNKHTKSRGEKQQIFLLAIYFLGLIRQPHPNKYNIYFIKYSISPCLYIIP